MNEKEKKEKKRGSIQTKIVILTIFATAISLFFSNAISSSISTKNGKESVMNLLGDKTTSISLLVTEYINKAYALTESLAYSGDLRKAEPKTQAEILARTVKNNPFFILFYQQKMDGDQTARSSGQLANRADRWWFKQIAADSKPFVTKSYADANTGYAVSSIIYPVYTWGEDGEMNGVLGADLSLQKLQEIIEQYNTEFTYSIIIDGEGAVVAHPDTTVVSEMHNYLNATKTIVNGAQETKEDIVISPALQTISKSALEGKSGTSEQIKEGLIYSYAPIQMPGSSDNWAVITVQDRDAAYAGTTSMIRSNIVLAFVILAVVIFISLVFSRRLVKPLKVLQHTANQIAEGDLEIEVHTARNDEIGALSAALDATVTRLRSYVNYIDEITDVLHKLSDGILEFELVYDYVGEFSKIKAALNAIKVTLSSTMHQIKQVSGEVASGSNQVSSSAQALSQGATQQASSIEELSATVSELSNNIQHGASEAAQASAITDIAAKSMQESNEHMQEMTQAMQEIGSASNQISKIIKTIDDIAFQTNILALNAAVEAARAGTAGKGFAVVADEVRSLASKSAEAAKSTASLIDSTLSAIEKGTHIADTTANSMLVVVEKANEVTNKMQSITNATKEQAASAEQISIGIDQIASVVQNTSATAEESAATSHELSSQAQRLKGLVDKFTL